MYPVLWDGLPLYSYGVTGALAFVVVAALTLGRARSAGIEPDRAMDALFWGALGGVVGARVLYGVVNPEAFPSVGAWFNLRTGGLVFYGGLLGGVAAAGAVFWRAGVRLRAGADLLAGALPWGHAIARGGCLLAGCCYGKPTVLPWGVRYSHLAAPGPHGVALHPTQLYEALGLVALGIALRAVQRRKRPGEVALSYLSGYAILRFVIEFYRGDAERGALGPLSTSQLLAILTLLASAIAWKKLPKPIYANNSR